MMTNSKIGRMFTTKTWHDLHTQSLSYGQRVADKVARLIGSWRFIVLQSVFVACWMLFNFAAFVNHWDAYPFVLLNFLFSAQAAYVAPIIMMSQNRQSERDRVQAQKDYQTNTEAKIEIEELQILLKSIELEKLDRIIEMLKEMKR